MLNGSRHIPTVQDVAMRRRYIDREELVDLAKIEAVLLAMDHVSDFFAVIDQRNRFCHTNLALANFLGSPRDQLVGTSGWGLIQKIPKGLSILEDLRSEPLVQGENEMTICRPDLPMMALLWSQVYSSTEIGGKDPVLGLLFKKESRLPEIGAANLYLDEGQIQKMLEAIVDPAIVISEKGIILGMNQATVRIFGYTRAEMRDKNVSMLMPTRIAVEHDGYLKDYKDTGKRTIIGVGREVTGRKKDGSQFPLHLSVGELEASEGKKVFIGTLNDLTQRDALTAAKAASEAKDQFLANMSHELRTPLNAILTFTQLLLSSDLDSEHKAPLENILQAGKKLLHEVEQILTFSKLEAKKHTIEIIPFDLERCIRSTVALQSNQHQNIKISFGDNVPRLIKSDPHSIVTILSNLISNAVKFSKVEVGQLQKQIEIIVKRDSKPLNRIRISVVDEGIGITREKQEHIFQAFSQEDVSTTRKYGGTGLGLAIVQRLVQVLDGVVTLESEPDKGSTFSVTLPFLKADAGEEAYEVAYLDGRVDVPNPPEEKRDEHLLVAEDDDFNMLALEGILTKLGFREEHIHRAVDGGKALALAKARKFDIILMDRQMPVMDGIDAARAIRNDSMNIKTPIIALTAAVLEQSRKVCYDAGMDDFCGKPIHIPSLCQTLDKWLPSKSKQHFPTKEIVDKDFDFDLKAFQSAKSMYESAKLLSLIEMAKKVIAANLAQLSEAIVRIGAETPPQSETPLPSIHQIAHILKGTPVGILGGVGFSKLTQRFYERICLWEQDDDWESARKSELFHWFAKISKAFGRLEQHLLNQENNSSGVKDPTEEKRRARSEKILIADDDPSNLLFLQTLLERDGYEVVCAEDGAEALALCRSEKPDLLLLDVEMPELTGHEVCRLVRKIPGAKRTPILFGTATVMDDHNIANGFEVGGSDYITKPYGQKSAELLARLHTHLELKRTTVELDVTLNKLKAMQVRLVDSAHKAGMADITGNILHSVGNVFNSILVSAQTMRSVIQQHEKDVSGVVKVSSLLSRKLNGEEEERDRFLRDKINLATEVLDQRSVLLTQNLNMLCEELSAQDVSIQRIRKFLSDSSELPYNENRHKMHLLRHAVKKIICDELSNMNYEIEKFHINVSVTCPDVEILTQITKFKFIIHVIILNAVSAMKRVSVAGSYSIVGQKNGDMFVIVFDDNGDTLPDDNTDSIFFQNSRHSKCLRVSDDLHLCSNFAEQIQGSLEALNLPNGRGVRFVLRVPVATKFQKG